MPNAETTIQPALTPEQWKNAPDTAAMNNSELGDSVSSYDGYANERHALAALTLYGQPFGFTQEELDDALALIANVTTDDARALLSIAEKIRALLPPT